MNDLQKKLAIVGSTAFIVWLFMAIGDDAFERTFRTSQYTTWTLFERIDYFITDAIYGSATWTQTVTFITWLGSLIAFNIYKD